MLDTLILWFNPLWHYSFVPHEWLGVAGSAVVKLCPEWSYTPGLPLWLSVWSHPGAQWYFCTVSKWSSAPIGDKQPFWSGAELHFIFFVPWRKLAPSVWGCHGSSYSIYILSWTHQSLVVVMWPCLQDRQLLVSQFHLSNLIQLTKLGSPVVRLCSR